jgi:hypothetical protein
LGTSSQMYKSLSSLPVAAQELGYGRRNSRYPHSP